jgi:opacity protein-like surface antigen
MIRRTIALAASLAMLATPAFAADSVVKVTLDGRPIDKHQRSVAILHDGVIFADASDLNASFSGLLTYGQANNSVKILIGDRVGVFTVGSRTMVAGGKVVKLSGAPFHYSGDIYVPLGAFVTNVAGATLRTSADKLRADILVANPTPK